IDLFSREENNNFSNNSPLRISSSCFNKALVCLVLASRISFTERNTGLSPIMTQALGEMETSQSVKAYSASIAMPGDCPGRSEERRVGKEGRARGTADDC